ncbi:hypothetical protein [Georgenia subflava]|uniref:Uncharacterized protein n=1 Tax=Georgenia subflava TaxID=1622177 RepID=A0A6N7EK47_9MICO|nr:hypothetical protein [Georgenia subflava]MPV38440.1 hypothetical protein [Georgenia subflava]
MTSRPATSGPASDDLFHERWVAALTALEVDVDEAERSLTGDHVPAGRDPWTPPGGLGPLPAALRTRAEELLARQLEVARQVTEAASMGRRQARAVQAMRANGPARPVYVDMAG